MSDPFDLERFVAAQADIYPTALAELRAGQKRSHWMWFVFPQSIQLGRSPTALRYGIRSLDEASAYLAHPALGPRLEECCDAMLAHRGRDPTAILGGIDALKLRSSMTLFEAARPGETRFARVLDAFYGGGRDPETLALLR